MEHKLHPAHKKELLHEGLNSKIQLSKIKQRNDQGNFEVGAYCHWKC